MAKPLPSKETEMTIKPRNTDPSRTEVDEREGLILPLNHHTSNPLFQGWGPKL